MKKVPLRERTAVMVHYHGLPPHNQKGTAVPHEVESIHLHNRWNGIGYNFLVDMDGVVYEGRGVDLQGAHCPGWNYNAWGVYVAVGVGQEPTPAALRAVRDLYDHLCEVAGRELRKMGHRDGKATSCPGDYLYEWVHKGMPRPGGKAPAAPKYKQAEVLLQEDGVLGPKTISKLQVVFRTPVDGKLDGVQDGVLVGEHHNEGDPDASSPCTAKIQHRLNGDYARNLALDGYLGEETAKVLQKHLGVKEDGRLGKVSITALQHKINTEGW